MIKHTYALFENGRDVNAGFVGEGLHEIVDVDPGLGPHVPWQQT